MKKSKEEKSIEEEEEEIELAEKKFKEKMAKRKAEILAKKKTVAKKLGSTDEIEDDLTKFTKEYNDEHIKIFDPPFIPNNL